MVFNVFSSKNIGFCNVCWSGQKKKIIKSHQNPLVLDRFFFINNSYTCQHDIFFVKSRYTYQPLLWSDASKYKIPYKIQWFLTFFLPKTLDFVTFAEVVRRKISSKVIKNHWFWTGVFLQKLLYVSPWFFSLRNSLYVSTLVLVECIEI